MKNTEKIKFEEALTALDDIVKKLESGNLALDDSLNAFEEAVELVKLCNNKLEAAEQKVRILTEGADGTVSDKPFEIAEDAT